MFLEGWRITRHWCRCPAAPMHQQYLSIQDTHAPALANTRNPRMRYTRAPRRGLIVASQFFPFFIKRKKNIVPSHLETRRYPDGRPRSGPIPIRIGAKKAQTANGQLDACFMLCVHVCHETTTVTDPIVFYFLRITARHLIWLSKGWFSRFQNWWSRNKSWNTYLKSLNPRINPGIYIQPY